MIPPRPLTRSLSASQSLSGRNGEEKTLLALLGTETRPPSRSSSLYWLRCWGPRNTIRDNMKNENLFSLSINLKREFKTMPITRYRGKFVSLFYRLSTMTWRRGGIAPPFFNSTLDAGDWSVSHPGCFTPGGRNACNLVMAQNRSGRIGS